MRALVTAADAVVGEAVAGHLGKSPSIERAAQVPLEADVREFGIPGLVVIAPGEAPARERPKRLAALRTTLRSISSQAVDHVILVSSGAIYGPDHHAIGFDSEDAKRRPAIVNEEADWWELVEETAREEMEDAPNVKLLVIRCPFLIGGDGTSFIGRVMNRRWLVRYAGFNPPLQCVSVSGLARAIGYASEKNLSGLYHVAPDDVVPLLPMLRAMGVRSFGVPRFIQRVLRPLLFRFLDGVRTTEELDYFRYPWTLSGEKFAEATGLRLSSREALAETGGNVPKDWPEFDQFGADEAFFSRHGKTTFRFAEKVYWRIESRGFENFPRNGGAIFVGPHRGFMPLDAVMIFHLIYRNTGRAPRFLIHPTLVKFPYQCPFFQRMATVMACQKNAELVLEAGGLLGIYPEGIRGAFKMFKEVYALGRFGRPDYARFALQFDVPVIPFAIVGSAEIFPILGKIKWSWLKKYLEWPFFPITPTFPLLPLPLPTKWHVDFLSPIHPADVRRRAEELGKDPVAVFTDLVRNAVDKATQDMLARRRSVYWGRIWKDTSEITDQTF